MGVTQTLRRREMIESVDEEKGSRVCQKAAPTRAFLTKSLGLFFRRSGLDLDFCPRCRGSIPDPRIHHGHE
jgi:hypothetical protein